MSYTPVPHLPTPPEWIVSRDIYPLFRSANKSGPPTTRRIIFELCSDFAEIFKKTRGVKLRRFFREIRTKCSTTALIFFLLENSAESIHMTPWSKAHLVLVRPVDVVLTMVNIALENEQQNPIF